MEVDFLRLNSKVLELWVETGWVQSPAFVVLWLFFNYFLGFDLAVPSFLFNPMEVFAPVLVFLEDFQPAAGIGDAGSDCATKIGSPSSSKRLEVSIVQGGYFRDGFALAAKLLSPSGRAFPGT